jgi:UDP-glucose-4-epimerase GalE
MRESVLVVGGAGYIGSHAAKQLRKKGYDVVILDDLSTGHRAAAAHGKLYEGSCADGALVRRIVRDHDVRAAMHFGAKALVAESQENPMAYYTANVAGTIALTGALIECGVRHFVFSSTCATYGEPDEVPIHEGVPQEPINPYGRTKLMVEQCLRDLNGAHGMRSAVLRYFNAAGADVEGELGEDHRPESHLIPRVIKVALGGDERVTINGTDYPTRDGTCVRDYVHVDDLAAAHIAAMELIRARDTSFDFNLGTERGHSVLDVITEIERIASRALPRENGPRRPGDPPVLVANSDKARTLLGWRPRYGLREIVETAYRWMKEHPEGYVD